MKIFWATRESSDIREMWVLFGLRQGSKKDFCWQIGGGLLGWSDLMLCTLCIDYSPTRMSFDAWLLGKVLLIRSEFARLDKQMEPPGRVGENKAGYFIFEKAELVTVARLKQKTAVCVATSNTISRRSSFFFPSGAWWKEFFTQCRVPRLDCCKFDLRDVWIHLRKKGVIGHIEQGLFGAGEVSFPRVARLDWYKFALKNIQKEERQTNRGRQMTVLPLHFLLNSEKGYLVQNAGINTVWSCQFVSVQLEA